jgi:alanyl aminopeptidase
MRRSIALACAIAASACARAPSAVDQADVPPGLELPRDVRPLRYALELAIAPERERFQGSVEIEVALARPTASIWLHARDLTIHDASVAVGGERVRATLMQATPEGVARLRTSRTLPAGRVTLHVTFDGTVKDRPVGLFRARSGGAAHVYTQLQPTDARRVFPAFDDPAYKTPFDVTLVVPEDQVAVSNAPAVAEERTGGGSKRVRFATTAPLPAYLVFAAVGPFEVVTPPPLPANEVRGRPLAIRAVAPRGASARLALALEATRQLVPILERWFAIPFPYEKLDQLYAPDFDGGMENAGAILYGDEVLFEPGESAEERRVAVGELVAHELAHQWFGDLVTPGHWQDVWLSESFATLMAWKSVGAWRPEVDGSGDVLAEIDAVMRDDALAGARAVRQLPLRGRDANIAFDAFSYVKGASILRGFEQFIGEARFREGLRAFLRANAHGTGTTQGIVAALSRAAGRDLAPAFHSLLDQPGVPLVEARAVCDGAGPRVELAVGRDRATGSRAPADTAYVVPVCVRYEAAGTLGAACTLVDRRGALALPACPRWVMPAAGGMAYYRWALGAADLEKLRDAGFLHLTAAERLSYAQSLHAAARAGRMPFGEALAALAPLARDGERHVATSPMPALRQAIEYLVPEAARPRARARAAELFRPRLRELGLDAEPGETGERRRLRGDIVEFLVLVARDPEVTRALAQRGAAYAGVADGRVHPEAVSADLVDAALAAAVVQGDAVVFDALETRLARTQDAQLRATLLGALGAARDPPLSARALALGTDPRLRPAELGRTLLTQASQPETREAAWKALQGGWNALAASAPEETLAELPMIAAALCDRGRLPEVRRFLERHAEPAATRGRASEVLESIEACAALRDAQGASAAAWLGTR